MSADVKIPAVRVVEALGTVSDDAPGPGDRVAEVGADPSLAEAAGSLVPPGEPAVTEVVYPQFGGLEPDTASVMIVARQTWLDGGEESSRTVTADVRLERAAGDWEVSRVMPVEHAAVASSAVPESLRRVVRDGRVQLPAAAAGDLSGGDVHPPLVETMAGLAQVHEYSVTVVRSGHPENVFGTDRPSNHTRERAVDVWAIDGTPVAELDPDGPTLRGFLENAARWGADEIGSPVDPDGPGGIYFTDLAHSDHVHVGFEPPSPSGSD